jgi:hypothetical protein
MAGVREEVNAPVDIARVTSGGGSMKLFETRTRQEA